MSKVPFPALADHISCQTRSKKYQHHRSQYIDEYIQLPSRQIIHNIRAKTLLLYAVIAAISIILIARLTELELVKGAYYEQSAVKNKTSRALQVAPRGVIKDRYGKLLAFNQPFIATTDGEVMYSDHSPAETDPTTITSRRSYPCGEACAHILGYTSLIRPEEVAKQQHTVVNNAKEERGRTGLEEMYHDILKGQDGYIEYEINAKGEVIRELGMTPQQPGMSLRTSIDQGLQEFIYRLLTQAVGVADVKGASVIVMDPRTGNIKALVNGPAYNNNLFTLEKEKTTELQAILNNSQLPLLNRAVNGTYPPGSTYKLVSSLALMAEGVVRKDTTITDTGKLELGGITFNNRYYTSYGRTDGEVNIVKALQRSNDTFYYKAVLNLGVDKLEVWSRNMGLGAITGIDLPSEVKGLVPNPRWKMEKTNEQWYPGNTVNMSIGQGDLLATPIQVALYTSVIANRGTILVPSIVQKIDDADGQSLCTRDNEQNSWSGQHPVCAKLNSTMQKPRQVNINREIFETIEEGMLAANARGGTATPFFDYPISTAGKTGTSESLPGEKPHAWYTVYGPIPNPQYVITVLVEHGGEGSSIAAPIAKDIMDYLFL